MNYKRRDPGFTVSVLNKQIMDIMDSVLDEVGIPKKWTINGIKKDVMIYALNANTNSDMLYLSIYGDFDYNSANDKNSYIRMDYNWKLGEILEKTGMTNEIMRPLMMTYANKFIIAYNSRASDDEKIKEIESDESYCEELTKALRSESVKETRRKQILESTTLITKTFKGIKKTPEESIQNLKELGCITDKELEDISFYWSSTQSDNHLATNSSKIGRMIILKRILGKDPVYIKIMDCVIYTMIKMMNLEYSGNDYGYYDAYKGIMDSYPL